MDKVARLRAFIHAADTGSFAAAGRRLSRSRDNVSKLVADLEAEVGRPLFQRSTRRIALTDIGETYLAEARPLIEAFDRLDEATLRPRDMISGTISMQAPTSFGLQALAPLIGSFLAQHRRVAIDLTLEDRPQARLPQTTDLALRISDAPPADYTVKRIGPVQRTLFAAPAYLVQRGAPSRPAELAAHQCLHYAHLDRGERWLLYRGERCEQVDIRGSLSCNTGLALAAAAVAGAGITILPHFTAQPLVASGKLVPVLESWRPAPLFLFALTPVQRRLKQRVQALLAFLAAPLEKILNQPLTHPA